MGFFPISFVIMRVAKCGFKIILNFSRRHNLQVFVTGLKIGIFASTTFQLTVGSPPASTCFQKCVESVVRPSIGLSCSAVLCFPNLFLNLFAKAI